ncbi:heme lyase CcmF/NrfE family subunit [Methylibium rhizosphaerae]|uniref:heme lyase CcmF/NrfE family subunit n=1 Tax=Methylibium rhizosphaerae TaxID=2570323 RepID=UPI001127A153|nr:heme lyase CcmF/NrfE family subunit [Methylibium rhizosphaerae]
MIPELGQVALLLALAVALVLGTLPIIGASRGRGDWMALARPAAQAHFVLIVAAYALLTTSFVQNDFSVQYVASNSNSELPLAYRIAGVWGGHEGSLLLWLLMLASWMLAAGQFSRHLSQAMVARVLGVMGLVSMGFLLFMLITSNPFDRLFPVPADGNDLNPLLQDPGMVFHPPMLYMGYVGFSVAFAFAIAALMGGQLDTQWARWARPWTTAAWCFLTIGIALGSWWAYYELGWGGWWFWDPVENASFMPWLCGTALIHSLAVTEKRGAFKSWTVLLAILAFSLSLLGTFLVRSGVLSSVHAFATDPRRGLFILAFLVVVVGGSLSLYAWRAPKVGLGARFATVSRESMLLGNNVLFVVATASVLLGTLYPLALDALGLGKISVGPPYFDTVFFPLMVPVVFLLGVGQLARWKEASIADLATRLRWAAAAAVVAAVLTSWLAGHISALATLGFLMSYWIVASIAVDLLERLRSPAGLALSRLRLVPRALWGMWLAHVGVAVFAFGVSMVNTYQVERDVKMAVGDTTTVAGHTFTFGGVRQVEGPNYTAAQGIVDVSKNGKPVTQMFPEKRIYRVQQNPMTEAAIDNGIARDLYVSLGEAVEGDAWIVRVYYKPFVSWIWGGCVLMALGGALAASDRRLRARERETATSTGMAGARA